MPFGIRLDSKAKNYNHMVNAKSQVLWQLRGEKAKAWERQEKRLPQVVEFELRREE